MNKCINQATSEWEKKGVGEVITYGVFFSLKLIKW